MAVKRLASSPQKTAPKVAKHTVSFAAIVDDSVPPHTLILGTHPSEVSFARAEYFGNPMNAFWWIAGDALGFRRDAGRNAKGEPAGRVDYFEALRHEAPLFDYHAGVAALTSKGFALWDVVGACAREGSLDADIDYNTVHPNDVRALCDARPSIRRICLGSGQESAKLFLRHHADWITSGAFRLPAGEDVPAPFAAKKWRRAFADCRGAHPATAAGSERRLTLAVMPSVSPAAASISYVAKREAWERLCYLPGLMDFATWQKDAIDSPYFAHQVHSSSLPPPT